MPYQKGLPWEHWRVFGIGKIKLAESHKIILFDCTMLLIIQIFKIIHITFQVAIYITPIEDVYLGCNILFYFLFFCFFYKNTLI